MPSIGIEALSAECVRQAERIVVADAYNSVLLKGEVGAPLYSSQPESDLSPGELLIAVTALDATTLADIESRLQDAISRSPGLLFADDATSRSAPAARGSIEVQAHERQSSSYVISPTITRPV